MNLSAGKVQSSNGVINDKRSQTKFNTLVTAIRKGVALTPKQQVLFKKLKKQLGLDNYNVSKDGILSKQ